MLRRFLLPALALAPLLALLLHGAAEPPQFSPFPHSLLEGSFPDELEQATAAYLPRERLAQLGLTVRLSAGQSEQQGMFISEHALMKSIDPPNDVYVADNTSAILDFAIRARTANIATYFALLPTSSAILQDNLPRYAPAQMLNQRQLIENIYSRLSSAVSTVDVYSVLFARRDEYIFYRTENNLTALGGYYVYTALGNRLDKTGEGTLPLNAFDITYALDTYRGDLYRVFPYRQVRPDTLLLYRYNRAAYAYTVTHQQGGRARAYHTLYPQHWLALEKPLNIYLGGLSAVLDIRRQSSTDDEGSTLLVFGDHTALAYLPFLATQYQRITFVDLFQSPENYDSLQPEQYSQILFAYSTESFIHWNNPSRANLFNFNT